MIPAQPKRPTAETKSELSALPEQIRAWAKELGFAALGITTADLDSEPGSDLDHLDNWLAAGFQGQMGWMADQRELRARPEALHPNTVTVISARMDYLPEPQEIMQANLDDPDRAYISRYALGRDYHKLIRKRLQKLADQIEAAVSALGYRVFCDSAPVLEKALARNAGLGWIGKHTLVLNREAGSWFFLGEIYLDKILPSDPPQTREHCGSCQSCIDICPTQAIVAPYKLDARRCISYLTIEHRGSIDEELRPLIGNRIFGCDDCQLVCPWNRYAQPTQEADFSPRHGLGNATLIELFAWDEATWDERTKGMALRRAGYVGWLRNLAIALGNAPSSENIQSALAARKNHPNEIVHEHVRWALSRHSE